MVDRPFYRDLGTGRSTFPKGYKSYSNLGSQRKSTSTRQKVGFFQALNIKTGQLRTQQSDILNAETFNQFLYYLLNQIQGKILMILDNARYHPSQRFKAFLHRASGAISKKVFATLLSRTQPYRKSLAKHPAKGNTQSLFSIFKRSQKCRFRRVYAIGVTQCNS